MSFLYQKGYILTDFSEQITRTLPSVPNSHPLPSVYSDDEISHILGAVDQGTMKGCRDFAILTLAARLGLRASDICGMTLGNVDFNHGEISIVQKKTSVPLKLPLLPEVRDALSAYISRRRCTEPEDVIFRQCHAPYQELTHTGLWCIMRKAKLLHPELFHEDSYTPHSFRHSVAVHMLEAGIPLPVIKNFLGHSSLETTMVYATISQELRDKYLVDYNASRALVQTNDEDDGLDYPDYLR